MKNAVGHILTIALLTTVASGAHYCPWTKEIPHLRASPVRSLATSEIVCHDHIMVLYDKTIDFPFATYAVHTKEQMSQLLGGRKSFVPDPLIPIDNQHLENDTIFHSPYSRGHLTPSHIMSYDKSPGGAWEETYYMSNILPQVATLNEGAWEKFEANIVDALGKQPNGTVWEIYTGGVWNGKYSVTHNDAHDGDVVKDYLFWKAFCDRKHCNSGMITAFHSENVTRWSVHPVDRLVPGIFFACCPDNQELGQWAALLNGVVKKFAYNGTTRIV
jgi:DNA/RNA endonuclease G (NUC1)